MLSAEESRCAGSVVTAEGGSVGAAGHPDRHTGLRIVYLALVHGLDPMAVLAISELKGFPAERAQEEGRQ